MKFNLKHILKEIFIGAILLFIVSNIMNYVRKPELSSTSLPNLELKLLNGSSYKLKKGKPLVLHFWGSWCPVCKLEAENIETVSKKYNVLTIAVNSGTDEKIKEYMKQKNLTFKVVNDNKGILAKDFHIDVYPTTFIYDANGTLKFTEVGYTTTAGLLARLKFL